jgi:parallel beta-helix repeat protein
VRADEVTVTGNTIINGLPGSVAVILDNSSRSLVDGNTIRKCDRGVVLYQAGAGGTDQNRVTNNRFESCAMPVQTLGSIGPENVIADNIVVP